MTLSFPNTPRTILSRFSQCFHLDISHSLFFCIRGKYCICIAFQRLHFLLIMALYALNSALRYSTIPTLHRSLCTQYNYIHTHLAIQILFKAKFLLPSKRSLAQLRSGMRRTCFSSFFVCVRSRFRSVLWAQRSGGSRLLVAQ